ncbi:MAG TPA: hypothetical protein VGL98_08330 [Gammaproteobacteria bacterium]
MKPTRIDREERPARGIRFSIAGPEGEVARAYLYVMTNDLHAAPFGFTSGSASRTMA